MGVAKSIEQRLEGLVEGFFTKVFRSGLQPIEVGRRILREMAEGKTVSVNRVYAPNEFNVLIGSDDYSRFAQMEAGLEKEFTELVIESAKENRWNLMGLPKVSFEEFGDFGKGEFRVEASFSAKEDQPQVATHEPDPGDPSQTGAMSLHAADELGLSSGQPQLLVLDPSGKPTEKISLTRAPVTVGRLSNNDVVLSDSNVSRRHAELRREGSTWTVRDLGSTNGTVVNGKPVSEQELKEGDRLSFGTSELVFKMADN
ncbi:MAG: FhaA domain-containing protein [Actinomycetota bacterium]